MGLREIEKWEEILMFVPATIVLLIGVFYLFNSGLVTWDDVKKTFGFGDSNVVKTIPVDNKNDSGAQTTIIRTLPKN